MATDKSEAFRSRYRCHAFSDRDSSEFKARLFPFARGLRISFKGLFHAAPGLNYDCLLILANLLFSRFESSTILEICCYFFVTR